MRQSMPITQIDSDAAPDHPAAGQGHATDPRFVDREADICAPDLHFNLDRRDWKGTSGAEKLGEVRRRRHRVLRAVSKNLAWRCALRSGVG